MNNKATSPINDDSICKALHRRYLEDREDIVGAIDRIEVATGAEVYLAPLEHDERYPYIRLAALANWFDADDMDEQQFNIDMLEWHRIVIVNHDEYTYDSESNTIRKNRG